MKQLINTLYLVFIFSCSCSAQPKEPLILVGSTPIGKALEEEFHISSVNEYDFMKWHLTLDPEGDNPKFILDLNYGEGKPNTTDFINGGKKLHLSGSYTTRKGQVSFLKGVIYELKSSPSGSKISFIQINSNLFHLISPNGALMVGNAGYSFTLNSNKPIVINTSMAALTNTKPLKTDTAFQFVFEGRTPCQELAKNNSLTVSNECFKIKWRILFNRDPKTLEPTTFSMRRINSGPEMVIGKWQVLNGLSTQPNALIYQLKTDRESETINLLVGDNNVLFVLDKNFNPFPGNELHSYTLNRKRN